MEYEMVARRTISAAEGSRLTIRCMVTSVGSKAEMWSRKRDQCAPAERYLNKKIDT